MTARAAFDEASHLFEFCQDETPRTWEKLLAQSLSPGQRPLRVIMRNTVPHGIPRYVCTAVWKEDSNDTTSSYAQATMMEAYQDMQARVLERVRSMEQTKLPASTEFDLSRLAALGVDRPQIASYKDADGMVVCAARWAGKDGQRYILKSAKCADKASAFDEIVRQVEKLKLVERIDWKAEVARKLPGLNIDGLSISFDAIAHKSGDRVVCVGVWSRERSLIVRSDPCLNKADAVASFVARVRPSLEARKASASMLSSARRPSAATAAVIQRLLQEGRSTWITERGHLMAKKRRTAGEEDRLRDLAVLLSLGDPIKQRDVDRSHAERLLHELIINRAESPVGGASSFTLEERYDLLTALLDGRSSIEVGMKLATACESFYQVAGSVGRPPKSLLDDLAAMKLINRKDAGSATLALQGYQLLMSRSRTSIESQLTSKI
jgi:hypothetical protein